MSHQRLVSRNSSRPEPRRELVVVGDDVYDAVVGYRMWQAEAVLGHVRLHSPNRRVFEWRKGAASAECLCIRPPTHTCGIYAWRDPVVPESFRYVQSLPGQPRYVFGEVALWGTVHVHELGYRAEFAKPTTFYVTPTMDDLTRQFVGLAAIQWEVPTIVPEHDWKTGAQFDDKSVLWGPL